MEVSGKNSVSSEKLWAPRRYGLVMNRQCVDAKLECAAGAIRLVVVVRMLCDSVSCASAVVGLVVTCY